MLVSSVRLMKSRQRNDDASQGKSVEASLLEPHQEGRVVGAQECRSRRTHFANASASL